MFFLCLSTHTLRVCEYVPLCVSLYLHTHTHIYISILFYVYYLISLHEFVERERERERGGGGGRGREIHFSFSYLLFFLLNISMKIKDLQFPTCCSYLWNLFGLKTSEIYSSRENSIDPAFFLPCFHRTANCSFSVTSNNHNKIYGQKALCKIQIRTAMSDCQLFRLLAKLLLVLWVVLAITDFTSPWIPDTHTPLSLYIHI